MIVYAGRRRRLLLFRPMVLELPRRPRFPDTLLYFVIFFWNFTDEGCAAIRWVICTLAQPGTTKLAEAWEHLRSVACDGFCLDVAAVRQRRWLLASDAVASRTVDALGYSGRGRPHRVASQKQVTFRVQTGLPLYRGARGYARSR